VFTVKGSKSVADSIQLAKKWHPDSNKEKGANERFLEIQSAYDVSFQRRYVDLELINRSSRMIRNGKHTIHTVPHPLKKGSTRTVSAQEVQVDSVVSKDSVDSAEEPETLVIYSSHCLEEHSERAAEEVETHLGEEVVELEMSAETIWKLPSLYLSWKLPREHLGKSQSPQW
jgi:hypothetical protein